MMMIRDGLARARSRLSVRATVARLRGDRLLMNSLYMMSTTVLTAGIGYFYWLIAARAYSASDVGLASALIAAMTLAATFSKMGIHSTFVQVLPHRAPGHAWSLTVNAGLAAGATAGLLAGGIITFVLPLLSPQFAVLGERPIFAIALILGVPLSTLCMLLDYTFVAERTASAMLLRNLIFALAKIVLLIVPVLLFQVGVFALFSSWVLAAGISLVVGLLLLVPRLQRAYRLATRGIVRQVRSLFSALVGHHFINLSGTVPGYLLPVLVTARLSAADNAYFFAAWMVGSLLTMVGPAVATSLFAEGSHRDADLARKVRSGLLIVVACLAPTMLALVLGGRLILSLFGASYAEHGLGLLLILVAAAVPDAIVNVYISVLRVRKQLGYAAVFNLGIAVVTLVLAWVLLPPLGIAGAGWASLIALTAGMVAVGVHLAIALARQRISMAPAEREARQPV
jgi:O-antigen/teichoic acid export membrane protein